MKTKAVYKQKLSSLLTKEENNKVISLLGHRCQTLATAVIQLFSTNGPCGNDWLKRDAGVLCLVRDANCRSYFFRLFCLTRGQLIWEHEVYNIMEYLSPEPFLHIFEAEECIVAFNFADEIEAANVERVLHEKLQAKEEKRLERRARANIMRHARNMLKAALRPPPGPPLSVSHTLDDGLSNLQAMPIVHNNFTRRKNRRGTSKITKADIGMPQEFRHVSHVGWDPDTGYAMNNVDDSELQNFFDKAGVSETHLQDKSTREFIYAFIEKHGGMTAVKEDLDVRKRQISSPTQSLPIQPPPSVPACIIQPLASPSSNNNNNNTTVRRALRLPSKTSRLNVPLPLPPPPPLATLPTRLQDTWPSSKVNNMVAAQCMEYFTGIPFTSMPASTPTPSNSYAPTNFPPPVPSPPPPLPQLTENTDIANNKNAGQLDTISAIINANRLGSTTLKHVDTESNKKPVVEDSTEELLNQIRRGVELKSVQPPAIQPQPTGPLGSLASDLAHALAERSEAINGDDSSTSESSDDYDADWEDSCF